MQVRRITLDGQVALMDQPRNHVGVLHVIVVMGPKNIGRNDTGKFVAVLIIVNPKDVQASKRISWRYIFHGVDLPILHVDHALGVGISKVGGVWWPVVDHCLIDGVRGFVWQNAGGETGDELLYAKFVCSV